ncbi:MAG: hypothetical protein GKR99_07765 [Rhodobacteraceae bacterium]|nr:hypothetical protein [Paracoccaceae bacterium]
MIRLTLTLLFLWAAPVFAQPFPNADTTLVNDFAGLLDTGAEAQIADDLQQLRDEHGVEMTVVTIESRSDYGDFASIEAFATGLFNAWGIGKADRNDGILVLVARADREMRIELGTGYSEDWNAVAKTVIDDVFLRAFGDDDYQGGILNGTSEVIRRIARPHTVDMPAEPVSRRDDTDWGILALIGAVFAAIFGRGMLGDAMTRFGACPQCGTRHRRRTRSILKRATRTSTGRRQIHYYCTNCDFEDTQIRTIARRSKKSSSSGFGGGSSSGGGASGRW